METRPQTLPTAIMRLTGLIHVSTALPGLFENHNLAAG